MATDMSSSPATHTFFFSHFASFLEKVGNRKDINGKRELVSVLLKQLRISNDPPFIYKVFRLLVPYYDRSRGKYNLKESTLARLIVICCNLPTGSVEAQNLKNWRNPNSQHYDQGDFSSVAFKVILPRSTVVRSPSELGPTLVEIDAKLDFLADAPDNSAKNSIFSWFMHNLTPTELKWLIRIILTNLRLGISDRMILNLWHPSAHKLWSTSSDLLSIAQLTNHNQLLEDEELQINVMTPFLPMLGYKAHKFDKLPRLVREFAKPFYLQEKIDGERLVLHYQRGAFRFYSRNTLQLNNYGDDPYSGSWTRYVYPFFDPDHVTEFILDGEMVAVDSITNEVLPFGTLRGAQSAVSPNTSKNESGPPSHPRYFVFDLLWLNGEPLANKPLRDRLNLLSRHFKPCLYWFDILPIKECCSVMDIVPYLQEVFVDKGEGLVVKDPNSLYITGERPSSWLKIKVDYGTELLEPMDLVVVGACWGRGKREGSFSSFLLALRDPNHDDQWKCFVRVGSGYSSTQADEIFQKLHENAITYSPTSVPSWLNMGKNSAKTQPDVIIHPYNSIVFEVVAAQITESSEYAVDYTLRFPRISRIRHDKFWMDADTVDDLFALIQKTDGGRLVKPFSNDIFSTPRRSHKRTTHNISSTFVLPSNQHTESIASNSRRVFHNWTFLIVSKPVVQMHVSRHIKKGHVTAEDGKKTHGLVTNERLHQLLREHGGTCIAGLTSHGSLPSSVQNPEQFLVVALDSVSQKLNNIISQNKFNIIRADHLLECIAKKRWSDPSPLDFVHMTPETQKKLAAMFDSWGDHFTKPIKDTSTLRKTLAHMDGYQLHTKSSNVPAWKLFSVPFTGIDRDEVLAPFDARISGDDQESLLMKDRYRKQASIQDIRSKYFNSEPLTGLWFSGMVVYPHWYMRPGDEITRASSPQMRLAVSRLIFYGAEVTSALHARSRDITHILIQDASADLSDLGLVCRTVSLDWVSACCKAKTMLAEFCNRPSSLGSTL